MPSGDFFQTGAAQMASPFADYMRPKTMSQQKAAQPSWLNVGGVGRGDPFGQSGGDISGAGWQNPIDLFTIQAEKEMAKLAGQGMTGGPPGQSVSPGTLSANGKTAYDQAFIDAAAEMSAKYGVNLSPALLKAMGHIESRGTFNNALTRDDGFGDGLSVGIMQVKPNIWGSLVPDANPYDPVGNIRLGAAIMAKSMAERGGSWERAITEVYFPVNDPNGTSQSDYVRMVNQYMSQYGAPGGMTTGGGGTGLMKGSNAPGGNASAIVQTATSFVGKVPYVWGGIPGKGQTPTGWDCSGFTFWLDQNYGSGDLPAGSHYQYQYAQQTGRLRNTPQVGDLVFFDTGVRGGGGANLNGASHVGMYIGNGQMVHAANPDAGTIISDFTQYTQMYPFLGAMSMSWSGGGAYSAPMQGGAASYGGGNLMAGYTSIWSPDAPWRSYQR